MAKNEVPERLDDTKLDILVHEYEVLCGAGAVTIHQQWLYSALKELKRWRVATGERID